MNVFRYTPPWIALLNEIYDLCKMFWVSKMVIPVYGVSEGEALCDWIY